MSRPLVVRPKQLPRPAAYWNMDNEFVSGSALLDAMGNANGTIEGTVTTGVAGRIRESLEFDGSTGVVRLDNDPTIAHTGASGTLTICAIVNVQTFTTSNSILQKWTTSIANSREFGFVVSSTGSLNFIVSDPDGNNTRAVSSVSTIPANRDVHVAVTFDASETGDDRFALFINGERQALNASTGAGTFTQMTTAPTDFLIGAFESSPSVYADFFDGTIDELVWFEPVLSDEQIAEIASRSLRKRGSFEQPPESDYSIWWSSGNVDGEGNITFISDARVETLVDQGSVGKTASQASASQRPHLRPARVINSRPDEYREIAPGIKFDGVDDILTFADLDLNEYTIFILMRPAADVDSTGTEPLLAANNVPDLIRGGIWLGSALTDVADEVISMFYDNSGTANIAATSDSGLVISSGELNLISLGLDGVRPVIRLNGVNLATQFGPAGPMNSASASLENLTGLFGRESSAFHADATMFEVLIYDRALSEYEILATENYFAEKYPELEYQNLISATGPSPRVDAASTAANIQDDGDFPSPTHYWTMDNSDLVGSLIIDQVAGVNGAITNASTGSSGQINQSFTYNATDAFIGIASLSWGDLDAFSVSAWFKSAVAPGTSAIVWSEGNTGDSNPLSYGFVNTSGVIIWQIRDDAGTLVTLTGLDVTDGDWHHFVYSQSDKSARSFYLDGVEVASDTTMLGTITLNTTNIGKVNRLSAVNTNWYHDDIDEIALWDVGLTSAEVFAIYERGAQKLKLIY